MDSPLSGDIRIEKTKAIESGEPKASPSPSQSFKELMNTPPGGTTSPAASQASPLDLISQAGTPGSPASLQTILTQVQHAQATMGDINMKLNTPNLKLRQSQRQMLKTKFVSANAQLRSVNNKLGNPPVEETPFPRNTDPLTRFLAYLTDGQQQLETLKSSLHEISRKGDTMNPADILLLQLKLNKAQQELEYSSLLLSKAVDDMKTLFSVQI
jgi:hypothetical protein